MTSPATSASLSASDTSTPEVARGSGSTSFPFPLSIVAGVGIAFAGSVLGDASCHVGMLGRGRGAAPPVGGVDEEYKEGTGGPLLLRRRVLSDLSSCWR